MIHSFEDVQCKNMPNGRLPIDFTCKRYGIECRMATEDDSSLIISLRTNDKLSKYLHSTENDIEKQREWMRRYEERHVKGEDYYFVYSYKGVPFSVNRIYNIKESSATGGSWICVPGTLPEISMASLVLMRDILFEYLGKDYDLFDVQIGNKQVRKLHLLLGAKEVGKTGDQENFSLYREDYFKCREDFLNLLNIKK